MKGYLNWVKWENIKVLPLSFWMENDDNGFFEPLLGSERYPETIPMIGRDGRYMTHCVCWLEVNGKAYLEKRENFEYDLAILNASEFRPEDVRALKAIHRTRFSTEELDALLYSYQDWLQIRDTRRLSSLSYLRIKHAQHRR